MQGRLEKIFPDQALIQLVDSVANAAKGNHPLALDRRNTLETSQAPSASFPPSSANVHTHREVGAIVG
jgi:hypothetical protein